MSHASVVAELSMDEILEKIQRAIATDVKEGKSVGRHNRPIHRDVTRRQRASRTATRGAHSHARATGADSLTSYRQRRR